MALDIKALVQLDIAGASVWATDKTGEYSTPDNEGGNGTPNPDLSDRALAVVAVYNDPTAPSNLAIATDVIYDNAAANNKETSFEFTYNLDGWHTVTLFNMPVSNDGVSDLESNSLSVEDYFYYTGTSAVCKLLTLDPTWEEVTDYSDMVGDGSVAQVSCERLFMAKLAVKKKEIYWDYREARDKKGECKETNILFRVLTDIRHDMEGAFDAFWSGLKVQAHDIVESLMKKHKIT